MSNMLLCRVVKTEKTQNRKLIVNVTAIDENAVQDVRRDHPEFLRDFFQPKQPINSLGVDYVQES